MTRPNFRKEKLDLWQYDLRGDAPLTEAEVEAQQRKDTRWLAVLIVVIVLVGVGAVYLAGMVSR